MDLVCYSQQNWDFVGVFNDKDIYYDKTSVLRGTYTYVLVKAQPKKPGKDDVGNDFVYLTVKCIYYKDEHSEIKCVISDRIYYYSDNTFRKSAMPKIEFGLNYQRVINDLYNKIK
jgi:hypothetical protein